MVVKRKNRIYSKQVLYLTSTPPLSKIRSAGILSIWQKETTSSHIWTAIKFEYFDLTKIRFFEIPWFFPDFQQNFKFIDFSLQGFFFHHFPCFPCFPVRGHPEYRPWSDRRCLHSLPIKNCYFSHSLNTLRKHAYSNILKISPPKTESFPIKILIFFIFLFKTLWVLIRTASLRQF